MENRLSQLPQIETSDSSVGEESPLASAVSESPVIPEESEALGRDLDDGKTALPVSISDEHCQISGSAADASRSSVLPADELLTDELQTDDIPADEVSDTDASGKRRKKKKSRASKAPQTFPPVSMGSWFVTLMCMNIPIIGWLYLLILACSRSAGARRSFAKAYLLYKFIFLAITLAILAVAVHYGLEILDQVMAYVEML